jgi:uncharacterized membrane protein YdjX (TVP38/TMEM64 family)
MQIFSSTKRKLESILMFSLIVAAALIGRDYISLSVFSNPEALAGLIGPYGYAGIIFTQFAQVLIAPLPPVTPVVSGMLYGVVMGTSLSFVGAALGSLVALLIGKRYGRPAVRRFLSEEALDKFDRYTSGHGYLPFVVLFVFPGFPDDALCFIAGLTDLDWKKLFLIASFGRIPGIALLAMTGSSAAQANTSVFLISASAVLTISVLSIRYERQMEQLVREIEEEGLMIFKGVKSFGGSFSR